ncbi:ribbon-helix-helix protein, CopG family [Aquibium sp. ELW1220]|uniref:ribbon-helix-helix protein, CopG family n=1 Tax=Aquibium sp. ELW1220 TaxID=2976766 RepID=UPI0025AF6B4E|nr:ribbon-helix-helix protein, CopG family [Aquibium sp. ELW1220]MDN2582410.1 ribbon-helix-helix domain-containing protein [Aquibium sp. ELW1220]
MDIVLDTSLSVSGLGGWRSASRASGASAMSSLTIRLPDEAAERLKGLAKQRGMSVNKLVERMACEAIASFDTESRFRALAATADVPAALAVLDRLDRDDRGPDRE